MECAWMGQTRSGRTGPDWSGLGGLGSAGNGRHGSGRQGKDGTDEHWTDVTRAGSERQARNRMNRPGVD
jgi:hypothetical protein